MNGGCRAGFHDLQPAPGAPKGIAPLRVAPAAAPLRSRWSRKGFDHPRWMRQKAPRTPNGVQGALAHPKGFEPLTYRLGGGRSILLSYGCTRFARIDRRTTDIIARTCRLVKGGFDAAAVLTRVHPARRRRRDAQFAAGWAPWERVR